MLREKIYLETKVRTCRWLKIARTMNHELFMHFKMVLKNSCLPEKRPLNRPNFRGFTVPEPKGGDN